jgi:hypothetical protein
MRQTMFKKLMQYFNLIKFVRFIIFFKENLLQFALSKNLNGVQNLQVTSKRKE